MRWKAVSSEKRLENGTVSRKPVRICNPVWVTRISWSSSSQLRVSAACDGGSSSDASSGSSSSSSSGSSTSTRSTEKQGAARATDRPAASKTVTTPTGKKVKKGDGEYKVVKGDTLSSIAEKHHVKGGWQKLFKLNKGVVEKSDLIYPDQKLTLK